MGFRITTDGELRNGLDNLCKVNNKVDYIISHCAPTSIQNAFNPYYPDNKLTKYFEEIKDKVEFKKWYLGTIIKMMILHLINLFAYMRKLLK